MIVFEKKGLVKGVKSDNYNFLFDCTNGNFMRWGKTKEDNPTFSPYGPEIADIEISTKCSKGCPHCYKSNTPEGKIMDWVTFKRIFEKLPKTVTQIAFGIGDIWANPYMYPIFEYCRENNVVPNVTINGQGLLDYDAKKLSELCGAVAVSNYEDKECFEAIEKLYNNGLKQINIHKLLSQETYQDCLRLIKVAKDVKGLNAIVFLWLKPKGNRNNYMQVTKEQYKALVDLALEKGISFGFDSCSAPMFLESIKDHESFNKYESMCEPCESTLFSYYINVEGIGYPCSFAEGLEQFKGIDLKSIEDFNKEVWFNKETVEFRKKCISNKNSLGCRKCSIYKLGE